MRKMILAFAALVVVAGQPLRAQQFSTAKAATTAQAVGVTAPGPVYNNVGYSVAGGETLPAAGERSHVPRAWRAPQARAGNAGFLQPLPGVRSSIIAAVVSSEDRLQIHALPQTPASPAAREGGPTMKNLP
jgi:hypothetical protein